MNKTVVSQRIHPFCSGVILMRFVSSSFQAWSRVFVVINNTSVFCLAFLNIAVVSPPVFIGILQGIAAGIGTSNFLRSAFHCELEFFIVWFNKVIPYQWSGIVELWFLIAHLRLAFIFDAADMCFHMPVHTLSGREVVWFPRKSPSGRTMCTHQVAFRSIR